MSIIVENLSKHYGLQHAVDEISFEVKKGEILGFLGPNGAGKTTTMKMLTCFMPQTSGKASVCGFDTETHSMEVRKRVGYLPEHNPLYKNMFVREYLRFAARLYNLPNAAARAEEMIQRTGLTPEAHKNIGALSKGYRQRVGLAQALLHNPDVLILDEPTSGLDPNQLADIRGLIKELGAEKTVVFSTHIMQEVEALCDRVIIINKGKIVADDNIAGLQQRVAGETVVTVEFGGPVNEKDLRKLNGVKGVTRLDGNRFQLKSDKQTDIRPLISDFARQQNVSLLEMHREVITVENIFQTLTGN